MIHQVAASISSSASHQITLVVVRFPISFMRLCSWGDKAFLALEV